MSTNISAIISLNDSKGESSLLFSLVRGFLKNISNFDEQEQLIKGPCATFVLCGRAVLSECVNKPYMNCKYNESIEKAMAANCYESPVQRDLEDHLFISGRFPASW